MTQRRHNEGTHGCLEETDCSCLMRGCGRRTKVICEMGDGVDSCQERYPLSSPRSLLFTFEPRPSSPSLIYRGSPLTPVPLQAPLMIDDHQHANTAQYFNFLPRKRNLRGWVKFRGTVWCLQLTTSPQPCAEAPRSKHSAENIPETGPSLCQQKNLIPPSPCLTESNAEDTDSRPNSLQNYTTTSVRH